MREAVLVQRQPLAGAGAQLPRQPGPQGLRDHRQVERQAVIAEAVEQRQQAVVAPAGVVVAEEHRHLGGPRIERLGHGIEPSNHSKEKRKS